MGEVIFSNKDLFEHKVRVIKSQGINKIHVVSDFDRTLTKCFVDGKKIPSGVALIREGGYLTSEYPGKAFALFDKYHPIEVDNSLDRDFKFKMMGEWWEEHLKLLIDSGMNKETIDEIISKYPKMFRDGTLEFLDNLNKSNIPLLIFSAGIGNLIEGYLKKEDRLTNNIHILSNTFKFNPEGKAVGYENEMIHSMNKSETKIEDPNYKKMIKDRNNIILLGDSIDDLGMVDEKEVNSIIKIGFLNEDVENKTELYLSKFDVVILNDGSMEFVNDLLINLTN